HQYSRARLRLTSSPQRDPIRHSLEHGALDHDTPGGVATQQVSEFFAASAANSVERWSGFSYKGLESQAYRRRRNTTTASEEEGVVVLPRVLIGRLRTATAVLTAVTAVVVLGGCGSVSSGVRIESSLP